MFACDRVTGAFGALGTAPDGSVVDETVLRAAAVAEPGTDGVDLVSRVTTTERYCVVLQTLRSPAEISASLVREAA